MKNSTIKLVFLSFVLILGFSACSKNKAGESAATPKDAVEALKSRGVLVIGYDVDFMPLAYRDSNNDLVGYDIELAQETAKRLGVELKALPIDWEDKDNELEN